MIAAIMIGVRTASTYFCIGRTRRCTTTISAHRSDQTAHQKKECQKWAVVHNGNGRLGQENEKASEYAQEEQDNFHGRHGSF